VTGAWYSLLPSSAIVRSNAEGLPLAGQYVASDIVPPYRRRYAVHSEHSDLALRGLQHFTPSSNGINYRWMELAITTSLSYWLGSNPLLDVVDHLVKCLQARDVATAGQKLEGFVGLLQSFGRILQLVHQLPCVESPGELFDVTGLLTCGL